MSLGVRDNKIGTVNQGDTAELYASLYVHEVPVGAGDIASVDFVVQQPDNTTTTESGSVLADGQGYLRWTDTTQVGQYVAQARFTLASGEVRSTMVNFGVINPFEVLPQSQTEFICDQVWLRLSDMFDSIEGGPWLRDETLANFDEDKIAQFIPEVIFEFNTQMPPTTALLADFALPNSDGTPNVMAPLLVKGVLCATIRHLMRSYIEQPTPQGAQIVYEDRTRYFQSWQAMYQIEHQEFIDQTRLWKRQTLGLGHSSLLLASKAGRLMYGQQRLRSAGRGYF